jgi:hypothetical protein
MSIQKTITWDVVQSPVFANNTLCNGYQALTRSDNGHLLNIARHSYTPTSNARLMAVAEQLAGITGFILEGYDTFNSGRKVLAYLKNKDKIKVGVYDFDNYMVIGNSHDYSTGFFVGTTTVMLRCENQFSRINRQMNVQHTRNHDIRIDGLVRYFKGYLKERDQLFTRMETFRRIPVDRCIIDGLLNRLLGMEQEEKRPVNGMSTRMANIKAELEYSMHRECADLGDNLLGLFNGITHYTTHVKKSKEAVFGNVLGGAATVNEKAFQFCESLALDKHYALAEAA